MAFSIVACRSATVTGSLISSSGLSGSSFGFAAVSPCTTPLRIEHPASKVEKPCGQWSRPAVGFICGVRPNSPAQTTNVVSSKSRSSKRRSNAASPKSSVSQAAVCKLWLLTCESQPPNVTSTHLAPTSIKRDAAKQPRPNLLSPKPLRSDADSSDTSNALSCSLDIIFKAAFLAAMCCVRSLSRSFRRPRANCCSTKSKFCKRF